MLVSGDRKNGVTSVRYKRLLQTNEPIYDMAIPGDREVSVIAAIGPLNSRMEVNAHSHTASDHNVDDIRINFAARVREMHFILLLFGGANSFINHQSKNF